MEIIEGEWYPLLPEVDTIIFNYGRNPLRPVGRMAIEMSQKAPIMKEIEKLILSPDYISGRVTKFRDIIHKEKSISLLSFCVNTFTACYSQIVNAYLLKKTIWHMPWLTEEKWDWLLFDMGLRDPAALKNLIILVDDKEKALRLSTDPSRYVIPHTVEQNEAAIARHFGITGKEGKKPRKQKPLKE